MPQLDVSTFPSQIFWLVVCFAILCFAMATYFAPRLAKSLEIRQNELDMLSIKADQLLSAAKELSLANQKNFEAAKHDCSQKLHKTLGELGRLRDEKIRAFEKETQDILGNLQKALNTQKDEILESAPRLITHFVGEIFNRITGRHVEESQIEKLVSKIAGHK